jgi:hypothetical protein
VNGCQSENEYISIFLYFYMCICVYVYMYICIHVCRFKENSDGKTVKTEFQSGHNCTPSMPPSSSSSSSSSEAMGRSRKGKGSGKYCICSNCKKKMYVEVAGPSSKNPGKRYLSCSSCNFFRWEECVPAKLFFFD